MAPRRGLSQSQLLHSKSYLLWCSTGATAHSRTHSIQSLPVNFKTWKANGCNKFNMYTAMVGHSIIQCVVRCFFFCIQPFKNFFFFNFIKNFRRQRSICSSINSLMTCWCALDLVAKQGIDAKLTNHVYCQYYFGFSKDLKSWTCTVHRKNSIHQRKLSYATVINAYV